MSEPIKDVGGINLSNLVTWAIVVLGMGVTYGTLYGAMRGSVDSISQINDRQDQFVSNATDLLTSLQMQNVQTAADLRQIRETTDRLQEDVNKQGEFLQGQINDLRDELVVQRRILTAFERYIDRSTGIAPDEVGRRPPDERSPPVDLYPPALRGEGRER